MHDNNRKKPKEIDGKPKKVKLLISEDDKFYINKVNTIRKKDATQKEIDNSYSDILNKIAPKIKKIAAKFKIPGHTYEDSYQECLYALRYKAIKDYDKTKGSEPGKIASFERFSLLCVKRHLTTVLKSAKQTKHEAMNSSKSIDQDNSGTHDDLSLSNILCSGDKEIVEQVIDNDHFKIMINKLLGKLSTFEKQVFYLYAKQNSYEEIAVIIAESKGIKMTKKNKDTLIKSIDNSLSRLKQKGRMINESLDNDNKEA